MDDDNLVELRKFLVPEFVFGAGARFLAGRYARNFGGRKVLVVSDPQVQAAGWTGQVIAGLAAQDMNHVLFTGVTPNPREEEVMAGAEMYAREGCNVIVAIGGGSPIDCAKGIGLVTSNGVHVLEFAGIDRVARPGPPLICVPTTAGTSADLSQFAIILDQAQRRKVAIISMTTVPDVALIDPVTTTTLTAGLTAYTALDALTHAVEAFVSNASSPITDLHALEAARLVTTTLLPALAEPNNLELRRRLMLGSLHAGLAFSNASLGLVHAMAHSLGGYLDLPHGACNALLLEFVVAYNFPAAAERYRRLGEAIGLSLARLDDPAACAALVAAFNRLRRAAGVDQSLGQWGVSREDIPPLAAAALADPCLVTNPRRPSRQDIEAIYEAAR